MVITRVLNKRLVDINKIVDILLMASLAIYLLV